MIFPQVIPPRPLLRGDIDLAENPIAYANHFG